MNTRLTPASPEIRCPFAEKEKKSRAPEKTPPNPSSEGFSLSDLRIILESLPNGILILSPDHHTVLHNRMMKRLLALDEKNLPFEAVYRCIRDKDVADFFEERLLRNPKKDFKDFTFDRSGRSVTLRCSVLPLVREKSLAGNLLYAEDITEENRRTARLHQSEQLASLTTLAGQVAHEIKNPLAAISLHLQFIEKLLAKESLLRRDKMDTSFTVIRDELKRLVELSSRFLFSTRPLRPQIREESPDTVITEVLRLLEKELKKKKITLSREQSPVPLLLDQDSSLLKQALLNLLKNSMEALPPGGKIRIRTFFREGMVHLEIEDNGKGILPEHLPRIFEPYFSTKEEGSGLGLSTVYKILNLHKGHVNVQSFPGKGTLFTCAFPPASRLKKELTGSRDREELTEKQTPSRQSISPENF